MEFGGSFQEKRGREDDEDEDELNRRWKKMHHTRESSFKERKYEDFEELESDPEALENLHRWLNLLDRLRGRDDERLAGFRSEESRLRLWLNRWFTDRDKAPLGESDVAILIHRNPAESEEEINKTRAVSSKKTQEELEIIAEIERLWKELRDVHEEYEEVYEGSVTSARKPELSHFVARYGVERGQEIFNRRKENLRKLNTHFHHMVRKLNKLRSRLGWRTVKLRLRGTFPSTMEQVEGDYTGFLNIPGENTAPLIHPTRHKISQKVLDLIKGYKTVEKLHYASPQEEIPKSTTIDESHQNPNTEEDTFTEGLPSRSARTWATPPNSPAATEEVLDFGDIPSPPLQQPAILESFAPLGNASLNLPVVDEMHVLQQSLLDFTEDAANNAELQDGDTGDNTWTGYLSFLNE